MGMMNMSHYETIIEKILLLCDGSPKDQSTLLEAIGNLVETKVVIEKEEWPPSTDGLILKNTPEKYIKICINSLKSPTKQLHTLYHEVGHIVLGHPTIEEAELKSVIGHNPGLAMRSHFNTQNWQHEQEAESFAYLLKSKLQQLDETKTHSYQTIVKLGIAE